MSCKLRHPVYRIEESDFRLDGPLGPILFHIYINDLPNCIEPTNSVLYTEDATYGLTRNISYAFTKLTESNISKFKS